MKNNLIKFLLPILVLFILWSCEKKENKLYYEGGTPPLLTASKTGTVALSFANKDQEAVKISWTNPDYKFTTGLSSQGVTYQVEIDTTGANFTNPNRKIINISNDLSLTLTQNDLNDYLLNQLQLVPGMPHNIEMRVKSFLPNNNGMLTSNVLKFTVTPFSIPPKVAPPATGKLFIVGNATNGDWNNPVPVPSQEFTKISPTLFEITLTLKAGSYLFLAENGKWDIKYGAIGANNSNNANGDDFRIGGGDMLAPAASGSYKIQVDFQRGKFTVTKL